MMCSMNEEVKFIEVNDTWSVVKLPQGKNKIYVKWVFKVKLNPKGDVTRQKAKLVANGFL